MVTYRYFFCLPLMHHIYTCCQLPPPSIAPFSAQLLSPVQNSNSPIHLFSKKLLKTPSTPRYCTGLKVGFLTQDPIGSLEKKIRSQEAIQQAKCFDPLGQRSGYYSQGYGVNGAKCCILAISRDLI